MIQVVYRWEVPTKNHVAFVAAWEQTTVAIREFTEGARGSICLVSTDRPNEILTIAKWDNLEQWQAFIKTASLTSMKAMHDLGTKLSSRAYQQAGDFTV